MEQSEGSEWRKERKKVEPPGRRRSWLDRGKGLERKKKKEEVARLDESHLDSLVSIDSTLATCWPPPDPTIFTGTPCSSTGGSRPSCLQRPSTFPRAAPRDRVLRKVFDILKKQTSSFLVDTSWLARRRGFLGSQLGLEAEQKAKWWALIH